jgi:hypothetical protein
MVAESRYASIIRITGLGGAAVPAIASPGTIAANSINARVR